MGNRIEMRRQFGKGVVGSIVLSDQLICVQWKPLERVEGEEDLPTERVGEREREAGGESGEEGGLIEGGEGDEVGGRVGHGGGRGGRWNKRGRGGGHGERAGEGAGGREGEGRRGLVVASGEEGIQMVFFLVNGGGRGKKPRVSRQPDSCGVAGKTAGLVPSTAPGIFLSPE